MLKNIVIKTTDKELYSELSSKNIEGITVKYKPVELAFDHAIDAECIIELIITLSSSVAINIFSNWIYDKLKRNPNQQITINGNIISGQNIEIRQIYKTIPESVTPNTSGHFTLLPIPKFAGFKSAILAIEFNGRKFTLLSGVFSREG